MSPRLPNTFRVAVFSDIHAGKADHKDTYSITEPPIGAPRKHPVADLFKLFDEQKLRADLVLCPGDLSNRSDDTGKVYGWRRLIEIGAAMGASKVIATPGNHDLNTHEASVDPTAMLRNLIPSYPSGNNADDALFWSQGYFLDDSDPSYRVLNLNSCVDFPPHPGPSASATELADYKKQLDRGGLSEEMQVRISAELEGLAEKPINILMCHHHPVEHERIDLFKDTYGPMVRGDELVEMLDRADNCGRWMIVHGHKHVPLLTTTGASANSPLVLCAASLGGSLWHPIVTVTRNQFHIIEFETDRVTGLATTRGTIRSYMWGYGAGWIPAQAMSGLPAECGFGMPHDHRDLAATIDTTLDDVAREFMSWSDLATSIPSLRYQGPKDLELLSTSLDRLGLTIERDNKGIITDVARRVR